jgi:hypothetical protein
MLREPEGLLNSMGKRIMYHYLFEIAITFLKSEDKNYQFC